MNDSQRAFAARALRRKGLFLSLATVGLVVAFGLALFYVWRRLNDPMFPIGPRMVIVLLVLLNARQNLRQYRFTCILEELLERTGEGARPAAS